MNYKGLSFIIYHLSFSVALLSFSLVLTALSACSSDDNIAGNGTLSGNGKTPLHVAVSLNNGQATTRATDNTFAAGDKLKVYLRHTTATTKQPVDPGNPESPLAYPTTPADQAPCLVTFTVKDNPTHTAYTLDPDNTNETSDLTVSYNKTPSGTASELYWDDFSNSSSDLRTSGHGLQSYYGYCYNGGTPSTALTESTGELGWTLATDQKLATAVKQGDLLWSMEQAPVTYDHSTARNGDRTGLTIPFTHAMSEITVTLTADATFSASPFTSTSLTLNNMNTVVYPLSAPDTTFTSGTLGNITMCGADYTTGSTRNFTAIVAPGTKLKEGELLLNITNVDGNDYTLNITADMLTKDTWATYAHSTATTPEQQGTEGGKKFILTKPGYNYRLYVNLSKTKITERATIKNWETVNATGDAIINFPHDLTANVKGHRFADESTYNLFQLEYEETLERTNTAYKFVTVPKYDFSTETWTNTPTLYWPNAETRYFFRALAKQLPNHKITTVADEAPASPATAAASTVFAVTQGGDDILWGTTPAYNERATVPVTYDYPEGAAIYARTDSVPIAFEHALAKVTFNLATSAGDVGDNNNAVDLTNATIAVSNLITSGTIRLEDGEITEKPAATANAITATTAPIKDLIVIPQDITNASIITITLKDGTKYELQLNQCKDGSSNTINKWKRGENYVYTITVLKEEITFRALVKDWEEQTGSGVANLEWD